MIDEMRTYSLQPGSVAEVEKRFGECVPERNKFSPLGAFFHTEFGPLNQIIHIWPYEDAAHREKVRAEARVPGKCPPPIQEFIVSMDSWILNRAPFMKPLGQRQLGSIYEMRMYTMRPGAMPEVLKRWGEKIEEREKFSPLAACWYTETGPLNLFIHVWAYKDMAQRNSVRDEARASGKWPPNTREFVVKQENKLLIPASFSPMH